MAIIKVTEENFKQEVVMSDKTVLVDLYADWCGPCQMMAPILAEIDNERDDIKVVKINIDDDPQLAQDFRVGSIPFIAVMKNGVFVNKSVGYRSKEHILAML